MRMYPRGKRVGRLLAAFAVTIAGCSGPGAAPGGDAALGVAAARFEVSPPSELNPVRGHMIQDVVMVDGYISMFFELRNVGSQALTFINTLYDYEPDQLYAPTVSIAWEEGGNAVSTRAGRFFPSPAIVQPGETAVYIMGGQKVNGSGALGELETHIKDCPTRGMDDVPAAAAAVENVSWEFAEDGSATVRGELVELDGSRRQTPPTVGVAFFDESGAFAGAIVSNAVGGFLDPHERRSFEISGYGVRADAVARVVAYAFIG